MTPVCRVCGGATVRVGERLLLRRHVVGYHRCSRCGFVQTDEPHWLAEAYARPITMQDTGSLERVLHLATVTRALMALAFPRAGKCLDFGGGYGIFVRRMRDLGADFRWEDAYCQNLLAAGFDAKEGEDGFSLATCFEVLEHVPAPGETVASLLRRAEAVLISTELQEGWSGALLDWPYLAPEHGQHIGLLSVPTLREIAAKTGAALLTNGRNLHLLSRRPVPAWKFRLAANPKTSRIVARLARARSLAETDHRRARTMSESDAEGRGDAGRV